MHRAGLSSDHIIHLKDFTAQTAGHGVSPALQRYVCGAAFNNIYFCGIRRNIRAIFQDLQEVSFGNEGSHGSFILRVWCFLDMESIVLSEEPEDLF